MFMLQDKPLSPDLQVLLDAVALLDISEFRLFELAYQDWYGKPAKKMKLEGIFVRYMYCEEIPFWVRHYAREIMQQDDQLQDNRLPHAPRQNTATAAAIRRGLRVLLGLIFILVFLIIVTNHSPEWLLFGEECFFPPCY